MSVRVIPLCEHHSDFCAEDIEIWEVTRNQDMDTRELSVVENMHTSELGDKSVNINSKSQQSYQQVLEIKSWGQTNEVTVIMCGIELRIKQNPSGIIGAVLWPSSVIVSR